MGKFLASFAADMHSLDVAHPHKVTAADLRAHLGDVLLGVAIFSCIILSCAGVSIAFDFHALRMNHVTEAADLRTGIFARLDAFLWKADTALTIGSGLSKSLSAGLMQVRVQVQQASTDQEKAIKSASAGTREVVKQMASSASEALQQAAATPAPVVNVEAPKAAPVVPPAVVVNPIIAQPKAAAKAPATDTRRAPKSIWRWLRLLWPFHYHHHVGTESER